MRARKVHSFTRGGDPYRKMGVGSHRPVREGDRFEMLRFAYWDPKTNSWETHETDEITSGRSGAGWQPSGVILTPGTLIEVVEVDIGLHRTGGPIIVLVVRSPDLGAHFEIPVELLKDRTVTKRVPN